MEEYKLKASDFIPYTGFRDYLERTSVLRKRPGMNVDILIMYNAVIASVTATLAVGGFSAAFSSLEKLLK